MRLKAARVPECATGQTRTTERPCGSADNAQARVVMLSLLSSSVVMTRWLAIYALCPEADIWAGLQQVCFAARLKR